MHFLKALLFAGAASAVTLEERAGCNRDNCLRAVQGTAQGTSQVSIAKSDCSSFLQTTTTVPKSTKTITKSTTVTGAAASKAKRNNPPAKVVPAYASACSGVVRYSSACSCWGIAGTTKTVSSGVTTVTVSTTISVSKKPSSSSSSSTTGFSSVSPIVPGPTFNPVVPVTYQGCFLDPNSANEFELLPVLSNGLPIINNNGIATIPTDIVENLPQFQFSKPAGAPAGIYDAVLSDGGKALYLAVFASGKVGFTAASSNGQNWVAGGGGEKYVTTIFNIQCNGDVSAGIINGPEFNFAIVDSKVVVDNIPAGTVTRRDIPVPKGFIILPKAATPVVSKLRCPNPGQEATFKNPPVNPTANGCGAAKGFTKYAPDFDYKPCCDGHDICFGTCDKTFPGCNTEFLTCMVNRCDTLYPGILHSLQHFACVNGAKFYGWAVTTDKAAVAFTTATKESCDCKCTDTTKTSCGDKCVDLKTDAENCGECFFHCPTGKCTNGACAFTACTNLGTCDAFSGCGAGGSCICASISDNTGFCVDGQTACAGLADCGTSADCGLGSVCAVGTCCGRNVCVTTDACGGKNVPKLLRAREFINATIGYKGTWMDDV